MTKISEKVYIETNDIVNLLIETGKLNPAFKGAVIVKTATNKTNLFIELEGTIDLKDINKQKTTTDEYGFDGENTKSIDDINMEQVGKIISDFEKTISKKLTDLRNDKSNIETIVNKADNFIDKVFNSIVDEINKK